MRWNRKPLSLKLCYLGALNLNTILDRISFKGIRSIDPYFLEFALIAMASRCFSSLFICWERLSPLSECSLYFEASSIYSGSSSSSDLSDGVRVCFFLPCLDYLFLSSFDYRLIAVDGWWGRGVIPRLEHNPLDVVPTHQEFSSCRLNHVFCGRSWRLEIQQWHKAAWMA